MAAAPQIPARAVLEARASHLRPVDFSSLEDAVAIANDRSDGLAAAVLDPRLRTAHQVARALRAGTVWVNTFAAAELATPFGGFQQSGSCRDRSLHAFDQDPQLKTTWIALS